jgi:alkylated DNA repair dioxygenase AlkB
MDMTEPLIYIPGFYTPEKTLALYNACAKLNYPVRYSQPWGKEIRHRTIGWSEQPSKRLGDIGSEWPLDTMPYEIRLLLDDLSEFSGKDVNYASSVRYADGSDHMAWHQHKEDRGRDATVWIVSTGAERPFGLKPIGGKATKVIAQAGSLIILSSEANETHLHSVPKSASCHSVRYSINCKSIPRT